MHPPFTCTVSACKTDADQHGYMIRQVKSQDAKRLRAKIFNFWCFPPLSEQTFKNLLIEKSRTCFQKNNLVTRKIIDAKERKSVQLINSAQQRPALKPGTGADIIHTLQCQLRSNRPLVTGKNGDKFQQTDLHYSLTVGMLR